MKQACFECGREALLVGAGLCESCWLEEVAGLDLSLTVTEPELDQVENEVG